MVFCISFISYDKKEITLPNLSEINWRNETIEICTHRQQLFYFLKAHKKQKCRRKGQSFCCWLLWNFDKVGVSDNLNGSTSQSALHLIAFLRIFFIELYFLTQICLVKLIKYAELQLKIRFSKSFYSAMRRKEAYVNF